MNFAGPADYAGVIVHNHGFLTFKARYIPQFEHRDRAQVGTNAISVTFRIVHGDADHFLVTP